MTIYVYVLPGAVGLARWAAKTENISEEAKRRLKVLDWLRAHQNNISLTSRHFGVTRETIGIWKKKLEKYGIKGLNDGSHRPKTLRGMVTSWLVVSEIVKLRKQYPAWSKYKLSRILERDKKIIFTAPEFLKHFDALCTELNLPHYFIYPRKPKENTYVENSHLSDENEFYLQGNVGCSIEAMQERLDGWEHTWNYVRPHEALGYLTPDEYSNKYKVEMLPTKNVIVLQA